MKTKQLREQLDSVLQANVALNQELVQVKSERDRHAAGLREMEAIIKTLKRETEGRAEKAVLAARILQDAKERAENEAVTNRTTVGVAVFLLLGIDRAIRRLE